MTREQVKWRHALKRGSEAGAGATRLFDQGANERERLLRGVRGVTKREASGSVLDAKNSSTDFARLRPCVQA